MNTVSENLVFLDVEASTKEEALKMFASFAFNEGVVKNANEYFEALK